MKKILFNKYDKAWIAELPSIVFEGPIRVVFSQQEAEKAVDYLLAQPILGIDTETKPSFKKGRTNMVSLLQVSTLEQCFLFRINRLGMPPSIIRFLEDDTVLKVGLSLHDDILSLQRRADFTPGLFIDLQDHMKELGIEDLSLQKLYANFFHEKISKNQRLTNWDIDIFTERQKRYAATDAWACLRIYYEYLRLKATGDYELRIVPEDEHPTISQTQ
ncbi:MAG: 3'-5' exonuclease domain-containing protein 2 [Prevotella sp.]|nr:3'-5' exonuclease domain-containing protein 2 [Prevotella sp.]